MTSSEPEIYDGEPDDIPRAVDNKQDDGEDDFSEDED